MKKASASKSIKHIAIEEWAQLIPANFNEILVVGVASSTAFAICMAAIAIVSAALISGLILLAIAMAFIGFWMIVILCGLSFIATCACLPMAMLASWWITALCSYKAVCYVTSLLLVNAAPAPTNDISNVNNSITKHATNKTNTGTLKEHYIQPYHTKASSPTPTNPQQHAQTQYTPSDTTPSQTQPNSATPPTSSQIDSSFPSDSPNITTEVVDFSKSHTPAQDVSCSGNADVPEVISDDVSLAYARQTRRRRKRRGKKQSSRQTSLLQDDQQQEEYNVEEDERSVSVIDDGQVDVLQSAVDANYQSVLQLVQNAV